MEKVIEIYYNDSILGGLVMNKFGWQNSRIGKNVFKTFHSYNLSTNNRAKFPFRESKKKNSINQIKIDYINEKNS